MHDEQMKLEASSIAERYAIGDERDLLSIEIEILAMKYARSEIARYHQVITAV